MADETNPGDEPPAENPKYDQDFFFALAAKGKDAWNAWRRDPANKLVCVTFKGIDFSEAPKDRIDFSGFEFGDNADFSMCRWRGPACFTHATFGNETTFTGATFGQRADFTRAAFGDRARFTGATFGGRAYFIDVDFSGKACFISATFCLDAIFDDTHFKDLVNFTGTSEKQWARDITDAGWMDATSAALEKWHRAAWALHGSGPDRFFIMSFANTRFDGGANFSGRTFEQVAVFAGARFYLPPVFDGAASASRIDFTGAYIGFVPPGKLHWTKFSGFPVSLRQLRKLAEETKNHDLERDLYIEERKAERGVYLRQRFEDLKKAQKREWPFNVVRFLCQLLERNWLLDARSLISYVLKRDWILDACALILYVLRREWLPDAGRLIAHLFWIVVMGVYGALADYGRSFIRPAVGLALSVWLFHWGYAGILAPLMPQAGTLDAAKYARAVWMLALGNAVPFVGPLTIDSEIKKFLFCPNNVASCLPPIPPEGFQALVIAQNVLSIILVFFIGLALRNYFKIK